MKHILLVLLFFNLPIFQVRGQNETLSSTSKEAISSYEKAQNVIASHDYEPAKTYLLEALNLDPNFTEALEALADIYRIQKKYENAEKYYKKVIPFSPPFIQKTYFFLGQTLFYEMNYTEAITYFEICIKSSDAHKDHEITLKKFLANAYFGKKALENPVRYSPFNLGPGVNSFADEYLPSLTVDDSTVIFTRKENSNEDFYVSLLQPGNNWAKAFSLPGNINSMNYNEGAGSISSDGKTFYFTLCERPGVIGHCDIYYSELVHDHWGTPHNLGTPVNTEGWESQPCISGDGNTLYFCSTRTGGFGGYDIWKSEKNIYGTWSIPVNLGSEINTSGNEICPFIHPDDETLYFSSDGWAGMGGKDLYISRKNSHGKWSKAENLGYPINTSGDESSLIVNPDGSEGMFASNSGKGYGGYDLYSFELYSRIRPHKVTFIKGNIADSTTGNKLSAYIEVIRLRDGAVVYAKSTDELDGKFLAGLKLGEDYSFHVTKKGYLLYSENFNLTDPKKKNDLEYAKSIIINLNKIALGRTGILRNIFFETNSFMLKPESKIELRQVINFMKINPEVHLEISGHTDNIGGKIKNDLLSTNRAKTVYGYLIQIGKINPDRFTFKGYGLSQPLASNNTELGRAKNRRTEFKIISL